MNLRCAPDFALSFSSDAVRLMERADTTSAGSAAPATGSAAASVRWLEKAVAAFDAPDFRAEMARLRGMAANGPDARVALIIPDDQILYTSVPGVQDGTGLGRALDGLTPYPVAELAWDWRTMGAGNVRVAAVARQTLREAEDFARRHGFAAEGFLADPPAGEFPAIPRFHNAEPEDAPRQGLDLPGDLAGTAAAPDDDGGTRLAPAAAAPATAGEGPELSLIDDARTAATPADGPVPAAAQEGPDPAAAALAAVAQEPRSPGALASRKGAAGGMAVVGRSARPGGPKALRGGAGRVLGAPVDPATAGAGVTAFLPDDLPSSATRARRLDQPSAPPSDLIGERELPRLPRGPAPLPDRARAVLDRAAAARQARDAGNGAPAVEAGPKVARQWRHPGARGGAGELVVMLGALLIGLMLIWAFATPGHRPVETAQLSATTMPSGMSQAGDVAPTDAGPPVLVATGAGGVAGSPAPTTSGPAAGGPETDRTLAQATASLADASGSGASSPAGPAAPAAGPAAVPAGSVATAPGSRSDATEAGPAPVAAAVPSQAAAQPDAPSAQVAAPGPSLPGPAQALAPAGADTEPARAETVATPQEMPPAGPVAAVAETAAQASAAQASGEVSSAPRALPRPSMTDQTRLPSAAPAAAEADQLPAVVPGRRALTRSERPTTRPASGQRQAPAAPAATAVRTPAAAAPAPTRTAAPAAAVPAAAVPAAAPAVATPRPAVARPATAPRPSRPAASAQPTQSAASLATTSSARPQPRPEGSAGDALAAAGMTDDERAAADLLLAGLYAQNPWLTTLTERASVETGKAPGADARGRRFAEARPVRPPAAARTAVDAALAEAVSGAERPATRAAPSAAAPAAVRAAVSTSGRPVSRPARGGSGQAVDAALAQALGSRPAQVEVASLAPVRKPIRSSSSAAPVPQTDAEAEAVAAAAAAALRTAPPAAPLAPPVVAAIPSPPDAAQRASDEALQRQAEERAREHARAEAAARAQAEANARAQAAAEERAAIAARGSYRPPENDDEPDIAQTPADGRTSADVARHATARGFEANKTQVIGVIGAGRASRGLIRLRSGKVVTVRIGDRIDGGAINKIGDGKISYVKGGRTYNLPIMNGR